MRPGCRPGRRLRTNQPRNGSPEATPDACMAIAKAAVASTKRIHAFFHPDITGPIHDPHGHTPACPACCLLRATPRACGGVRPRAATGGASRHRARDLLGAGRRRAGTRLGTRGPRSGSPSRRPREGLRLRSCCCGLAGAHARAGARRRAARARARARRQDLCLAACRLPCPAARGRGFRSFLPSSGWI